MLLDQCVGGAVYVEVRSHLAAHKYRIDRIDLGLVNVQTPSLFYPQPYPDVLALVQSNGQMPARRLARLAWRVAKARRAPVIVKRTLPAWRNPESFFDAWCCHPVSPK